MARAAAAAGVCVIALLAGAGQVEACSIAGPLPPESVLIDQADLVFEGVALARQDPNTTATVVSSIDPVTWTFTVENVVKGTASGTQEVTTARDGASCGFSFVVGRRYRVLAEANGDGFSTSLSSGTREQATPVVTTSTVAPTTTAAPVGPTTLVGREPLARTGFPIAETVAVATGLLGGGWLLARRRPGRGGGGQ